MMPLKPLLFVLLYVFITPLSQAQPHENSLRAKLVEDINLVIETQVQDQKKFYGLAGYYNESYPLLLDQKRVHKPKEGVIELAQGEWFAIVGRFNVLLIQAPQLKIYISEDRTISLENPERLLAADARVEIRSKSELKGAVDGLGRVRYSHLVTPIRWLCLFFENLLILLNGVLNYWPLSILAIAVLIKVALLPLNRFVAGLQKQVSITQSQLEPKLAEIKRTMKGEKAYNASMAVYKEQGVTSFYSLKPMAGLLVQLPIWIAIFNVLGEMPQLMGTHLLWISDIAYVDAVATWGVLLPLLGNSLNILPILMTLVSVVSSLFYLDPFASEEALKKQKRNLFLMSAMFLVLFYSFPATMVLYWMLANFLNFLQQLIERPLTKDHTA